MNAEELLAEVKRRGAILTPRLHVEAPNGAITPELKQALTKRKLDILVALELQNVRTETSRLRSAYAGGCFEMAEVLGWPKLPYAAGKAVCSGEALWRIFLSRASVITLRDQILPRLRAAVSEIKSPSERVSPNEIEG